MRAESADLAEDQAVVTQADVAQIGAGQPSLRARHPDSSEKAQRETLAIFSAFRPTMAPARSEELKSGVTVEYVAVRSAEDIEDGAHLDGDDIGQPASKKNKTRKWYSIFLRLWLAITYVASFADRVHKTDLIAARSISP